MNLVGWRLLGRGQNLLPGALTVAVGAGLVAVFPHIRIPVPLNTVGATAATTAVIAYLTSLPWAFGVGRDVPEVQHADRRRAGRLRGSVVWCQVAILAVLAVAGVGGSVPVARVAGQAAFFTGLACVLSTLVPTLMRWLPGFVVLAVTLVLGVNRDELEPQAWAWLLSDGELGWLRDAIPASVLILGLLVMTLRAPRDSGV